MKCVSISFDKNCKSSKDLRLFSASYVKLEFRVYCACTLVQNKCNQSPVSISMIHEHIKESNYHQSYKIFWVKPKINLRGFKLSYKTTIKP